MRESGSTLVFSAGRRLTLLSMTICIQATAQMQDLGPRSISSHSQTSLGMRHCKTLMTSSHSYGVLFSACSAAKPEKVPNYVKKLSVSLHVECSKSVNYMDNTLVAIRRQFS